MPCQGDVMKWKIDRAIQSAETASLQTPITRHVCITHLATAPPISIVNKPPSSLPPSLQPNAISIALGAKN